MLWECMFAFDHEVVASVKTRDKALEAVVKSFLWSSAETISWLMESVNRTLTNDYFDKGSTAKAALINSFLLTMGQMTMSDVKGVACRDEPTEDNHKLCSSPQLWGAFWMNANEALCLLDL